MNRESIIMLVLQLLITIVAVLVILHWQHIDVQVQCNQPVQQTTLFQTT